MELVVGISRKLHSFWREKAGGLMVAVTGVNATPTVNDDRWPEGANDFDHILQNFVAPDFFCFLWSFGIAEVFCASEKEFDAVAARSGEQLLRADETQLRGLLRAEIVLPAFAACERKERDFCMEAAREIGKHGGGFIVGVRSDVEDARSHAGVLDGLHCFRKAWTGARRRRKLGSDAGGEDQKD